MKRSWGLIALCLVWLVSGLLAACQPQAVTIEGDDRDAIVAQAEPLADAVLNGLESLDYATFSANFDEAMRQGLGEQAFQDMQAQFAEKLGQYQSREVSTVQSVDDYNAIVYTLKYSNAPAVTMRLVLTKTEPPQISGLWFDSPELRAK
jgi:uncharacterized protein YggE